MPVISASAPGKVILCGEHVVVYGYPAIALPVKAVSNRTRVYAHPAAPAGEVILNAPAIDLEAPLSSLSPGHPLRRSVELTLETLGVSSLPACEIHVTSTIPLGAGLGSSAATTVSIVRAVSAFLGHPLESDQVNRIAFEVEKIHHGTPSGIDNTVITYEVPILFQRDVNFQKIRVAQPFQLVIADSGVSFSTAEAVAGVRSRWLSSPAQYQGHFESIARLTGEVEHLLEIGVPQQIGPLLTQNHRILAEMGVSSPRLDELVDTAIKAGALGAKLSGGGIGGNVIALVNTEVIDQVVTSLETRGTARTLVVTIPSTME